MIRACLCLIMIAVAPAAAAHQQRAAISDILFNPRSGLIEVAHRFVLHDAEHALRDILGVRVDLHADAEKRDQFAAYVARRFRLTTLDGTALALTLLGAEADGGFLWVYQETPIIEGLDGFKVSLTALQDVWRDQVNTVNIRRGEAVQTLRLLSGDGAQAVEFPGD